MSGRRRESRREAAVMRHRRAGLLVFRHPTHLCAHANGIPTKATKKEHLFPVLQTLQGREYLSVTSSLAPSLATFVKAITPERRLASSR